MQARFERIAILTFLLPLLLLPGCGSDTQSVLPNGAPVLSALSMDSVVVGSPDLQLSIDGSGFLTGIRVRFGANLLAPSTIAPTRLDVTIPHDLLTSTGVVQIGAVNPGPGGGDSNALEFTVKNPVPNLTSLSLTSVVAGTGDFALALSGTDFVTGATVNFGSQTLPSSAVTPTRLEVTVPGTYIAEGSVVQVAVVNPGPGGGSSALQPFSILNPQPSVSALSIDSVVLNSAAFPLEIAGANFVSQTTVAFGTALLKPLTVSPTQLTVIVPQTAVAVSGVQQIRAVNPEPGGGGSNVVDFTVQNPVPLVSSLSLDSILAGSADLPVSIIGSNFVPETTVSVGSTVLTPMTRNSTGLSVVIPKTLLASAALLPVTASNPGPGGGISNSLEFRVENPVPLITALSIDSISAGVDDFTLSVTGSNFVSGSTFDFGSQHLVPVSSGSTQMNVAVPAAAVAGGGYVSITVTNPGPGGGRSNARTFTVYNPVPQLTALSSQSVVVGDPDFVLDVSGSNFVPQTEIQFGNVVLPPSSFSRGRLGLTIPRFTFATGGVISVRAFSPAPGGGLSNPLEFTVRNPVPVVSGISPLSVTAGGGDVTVTLRGSGFVTGSKIAAGTATLTPDSVDFQQLQITVPASLIAEAGTIPLTVTNPLPGGGNSSTFTMVVHGRAQLRWSTVANNQTTVPGTTRKFNGFNTPSVNQYGVVALKGQSKGESGPTVGIYTLDPNGQGGWQLAKVADNVTEVPQPNNVLYNGKLASFTQFPSFPRIDLDAPAVAFRAQNKPVYTYTLPDGTETRIGSAGVYTNGTGPLSTAVGLFGVLPDYAYLQVPGAPPASRFDQFPGSPGMTGNGHFVVFKGNYTIGDTGKTGVYYRDLFARDGQSPIELIANSDTRIPNQPEGSNVVFGSTAPPSAANGMMLFAGFDNEDAPTLGGIYAAPLVPSPTLQTIAGIGQQVPGEPEGAVFTRFGEGLSFDGRFAAFWGAWGAEMQTSMQFCSEEGEQSMIGTCQEQYPNGFPAQVPVHQGIFVYDMQTGVLTAAAKTTTEFDDFVYWTFSGRPPGAGGGGAGEDVVPEPPRWRSSSFAAVAARGGMAWQVAFKAKTGNATGIYLAEGPDAVPILTAFDTTMLGETLDPQAPAGSTITSAGLEREGLRGDWLVVSASMFNTATSETAAGTYITRMMMP